jgi:small subunit ribosomal protein S11
MAASVSNKNKKRLVNVTPVGKAYINATYNNIIITITNLNGDTIAWSSAGKNGFKNTKKKNTPYAAQVTAEDCSKMALEYGVKNVSVIVKGVGTGRETAIRTLSEQGLNIVSIVDRTAVPHGGCRPKKIRRN